MGKPTFDSRNSKALCLGVHDSNVLNPSPRGFGFPVIKRRYETPEFIGGFKRTQGTETSKYLEERTSTETPLVVASERGPGQWYIKDNRNLSGKQGLRG
jgi:hypothetical protein